MNELIEVENLKIEDMIYEIRGKQVMLDSDLAKLYRCKNGTKSLNLAVKRHINRFPERFMFQLTENEIKELRFQIETTKMSRSLPYAFTEQEVAMLATILRTEVAEQISIAIMDAFILMRKYIANNNYDKRISNIETKLIDYDNNFQMVFEKLETKPNNHLFYEGQIYDAYSLMLDIFNTSMKDIIIIDNYIDKNIFDILSRTEKKVLIITNKYNNEDYEKYKNQYANLKIKISNKFHDRFIIVDNKDLYHCVASFKDLGRKCFALTKIEDNCWLEKLLEYINNID